MEPVITQDTSITNAQGIITADLTTQMLNKSAIPTNVSTYDPVLISSPSTPLPIHTPESNIIAPVARRLSVQPPGILDPNMMTPTPPINNNAFQPFLSTSSSFIPANPTPPPASWVKIYPTGTIFKGDPIPQTINVGVPHPTVPPAGEYDSIPHPTTPPTESSTFQTSSIIFATPAAISIPLDYPASTIATTISSTPPTTTTTTTTPSPTTTTTTTPPPRMPRPTTPPLDVTDVTPRYTMPPTASPEPYTPVRLSPTTISALNENNAEPPSPNSNSNSNSDSDLNSNPNNPVSISPTNHVDVRGYFQRFPSFTEMMLPKLPDPTPSPVPIASLQGDAALCSSCNNEPIEASPTNTRRLCEGCTKARDTPTSILDSTIFSDSTPLIDPSSEIISESVPNRRTPTPPTTTTTTKTTTFTTTTTTITTAAEVQATEKAPVLYDVPAGPSSASGPSSVSGPSYEVAPRPNSIGFKSSSASSLNSGPKHVNLTEKWKICYLCGKNPKTMVSNCGHCMCRQCMMRKMECGFCKEPITRGQTISM